VSNALALASVTAVLKDLLDNAVIDQSISESVGGPVTVSALPPDRIDTGEEETARLNLFLYHVAPNGALRNVDLPSANSRGQRLTNPPLALDLHYLLTAYGAQDFEAEILLGYAMQLLHETPVLAREAIRHALAPPSPVDGGILPPALGALAASDLADQPELVKVSPHQMGSEEVSRLWTAFQAKYRPSAAYVATVVLIRSEEPTRGTLPVLTRGEADPATGRDRGVVVQPSLVPPFPALIAAAPPAEQPAIRMGEPLTLSGRHLDGDTVAARFVHVRTGEELELEAEPGGTEAGFQVILPPDPPAGPLPPDSPLDPERWRAGVYAVSAVVRRTGSPDRETNPLSVVLAPRLDAISAATGAGGSVTVTVEVSPPVHAGQRARLVVGTEEVPVDAAPGSPTSTLDFTSTALLSGDQWVRLRVDEAESLLVDRSVRPPAFDPSQRVSVP
jgi:hypothetical protein